MIGRGPFRWKNARLKTLGMPFETGMRSHPVSIIPILRNLIEEEQQARRPFLWLAPCAILGALFYAWVETEPSLFAAVGAFLLWSGLAIIIRTSSIAASRCMMACAMIAFGFLCGTIKTRLVDAPILQSSESGQLDALVETIDHQPAGSRLVLRPLVFNGRSEGLPERVRVKGPRLSGAYAIVAGDQIRATVHLMPPPEAARPGGYDFARDAYFKGIGAVGSLNGPFVTLPTISDLSLRIRFSVWVDNLRNDIAMRIYTVIGGESGAVAAALMTGKRGMISEETNEDLRGAGIYHVVSISGLHMVLAAGMIFYVLRLILGLVPAIALYWPVKKIAALGAMFGAFAYNIFAGSEVATERSLIMTLFLFGAILIGRPAISMRNLCFAVLLVVMLEPDSVTGPSFQMSFAAVAALIAVFERTRPDDRHISVGIATNRAQRAQPHTPVARAFGYLARHAKLVLITTLIAEAATAPYVIYHFQRFQSLGLIGNALSIPLIELVSMPIGFLGLLAMPFGLDAPFWQAMAFGVDPMLYVAKHVAALPIATGATQSISITSALVLSFGLVWIALWSSALRYLGLVPVLVGLILAFQTPRPDVYVARDGSSLAFRKADGHLHVMGRGASDFMIEQWLTADGDMRRPDDPAIRTGSLCNATGCLAELFDGRQIILGFAIDDLAEDCRLATVLVTPYQAPADCEAFVIDRRTAERHGAVALAMTPQTITLTGARQANAQRPWNSNRHSRSAP